MTESIFYTFSVWVLPVLFAITLHEAAHGYAALVLGDDTALKAGRLSLNPLRHVDRFGTVILPLLLFLLQAPFLFGWAKPVPVNFHRLSRPGMALTAAAGPAANLVQAALAALLIHLALGLSSPVQDWVVHNLFNAITINLVLMVFNLWPIPPLDGGRIAVGLLPRFLAKPLAGLERWGLFILIGILFILPMLLERMGLDFDPLGWMIGHPVSFLGSRLLVLAGLAGEGF